MSAAAWQHASNVLCVRLDNLGDVLMTTPALRALRESAPGRRLTLLASRTGAAAAAHIDEVDDVIVYDAPWMKSTSERSNLPDAALVRELQQRRFDAAVVFTVYTQSALPAALLCWFAGIPLRLAHCRENPYQLLTDWVPEPEPHDRLRHEVQRQLELVGAVACHTRDPRLSFRIPSTAHTSAARKLQAAGVRLEHPWLVLHPGASAASRRYPPAQYAAAARLVIARDGAQILLSGARDEVELVNEVRDSMRAPSFSLAGRLDLAELAAVIAHAKVVVTNNSGPAHIAAAVGTPVVDLYALTNPQHTPWAVPSRVLYHDVPCKFCYKSVCPQQHHRCLRLVTPMQIADAVHELYEGPREQLAGDTGAVTLAGAMHRAPGSVFQ